MYVIENSDLEIEVNRSEFEANQMRTRSKKAAGAANEFRKHGLLAGHEKPISCRESRLIRDNRETRSYDVCQQTFGTVYCTILCT